MTCDTMIRYVYRCIQYLLLRSAFALARSEIDSLIHLLGHGMAAIFGQVTSATSRSVMGGRLSGSEFLRLFQVWSVTWRDMA